MFALQLRGPFNAGVQAGSHLTLLSVLPFQRILALIAVFFGSVLLDYMQKIDFVKDLTNF